MLFNLGFLVFFKPSLSLFQIPAFTLVKKVALHRGFVFAFKLANNRLDAFLLADCYGAKAV